MNGNSNTDYVEAIRNKWMTGRGTRVLYAGFAVLLFGILGSGLTSGQESRKADVAVSNSIQMAQIFNAACKDYNFYKAHEDHCLTAQKVIADPTKAATPLVEHKQDPGNTSVQP